jgi:hypothetical protein
MGGGGAFFALLDEDLVGVCWCHFLGCDLSVHIGLVVWEVMEVVEGRTGIEEM